MQQQHLSVNLLGWVTGPQCLLEVNLLLASLQGKLGFQGQCLPLWELTLQIVWAQTLTTLILKLQTYPWIKSPLYFYEHLICCLLLPLIIASYHFVLKPLTNSYNLKPVPSVGNIAPPSLLLKYS